MHLQRSDSNDQFKANKNDISEGGRKEKIMYFKIGQIRLKNYHNKNFVHNELFDKYDDKDEDKN